MTGSLSLRAYRAATGLLEPLAPGVLARRARRGKEDARRLGERLGRPGLARPEGPLAWLHGVSVGEAVSLLPLAAALRERRPDAALLVTSGTRTAAELLDQRLPAGALHQYAPVDAPGAVRRFLAHWRPDLGVFVESELWPNLILQAQGRGVRLALLSARMTEESARGWSRARGAAARLLGAFERIEVQDAATGERLRRLGGRVEGRLNLKLAAAPLPCDGAALERLRTALVGRPLVLAASTHPGEETLIARAWREAGSPGLLAIAPRHPDRREEIIAVLAGERLSLGVRSRGETPDAQTQVYLADTLGELGLFFRLAAVTVMGGAFVPGVGGHNPLEPARLGAAIVTGPHVENAAEVYAELVAAGAARQAADAAALAREIARLLGEPELARRMGAAGLAYAEGQGAALEATAARLAEWLPR